MVVCSSGGSSTSRPRRTTAVLECTQCRRKFLNEADRELHVREAHQIVKESFECTQCGKQFGNRHILQLHTRLHASQSTSGSPESPPSDTVTTLTSTTQANGSLNINFNVSLNINLGDSIDPSDLDSKLNDLLANAAKASFQEALKREKRLAVQQKSDDSIESSIVANADNSPCKAPACETSSSPSSLKSEGCESIGSSNEENKDTTNKSAAVISSPEKSEAVAKPKATTPSIRINPHNRPKKTVGLTKIRMEDCQRCDACSCIYLDERDYIKHMKNFHKQDVAKKEAIKIAHKKPKHKSVRIERRQSKQQRIQQQLTQAQQQPQEQAGKKGSCRSCCKQCKCRGDHGTLEPMLPIVRPVLGRSGRRGSSSSAQDSWNQLAQHLEGAEGVIIQPESVSQIKSDPDADAGMADFTDLLSQVEVKIKTEPVDHDEAAVRVKSEPPDEMDTDSCSVY